VLRVEEGSLYPALQRLLRQGWVQAEWGISQTNRRVRVPPQGFTGLRPGEIDAWLPITQQPLLIEGSKLLAGFADSSIQMFGRLTAGLTLPGCNWLQLAGAFPCGKSSICCCWR